MNSRFCAFFLVAFLVTTTHNNLKAADAEIVNIYALGLFQLDNQKDQITYIQGLEKEGVEGQIINVLYELIGVDLKAQTAQPKKQPEKIVVKATQEEKYPKVTELLKAQEGAELGELEDIIPLIKGTLSQEEFEEFLRRLRGNPDLYGIMNPQNLTVAYYNSKKEAPNKPTPSAAANAGAAAPKKNEQTMPTSSNSGFGGFGNLLSRGLEFGKSFIQPLIGQPQVATTPTPEVQQPTPMPAVQQPIAAAQQVEAQPVIAPQIEQPQPPIRKEEIAKILASQETKEAGHVENVLIGQMINMTNKNGTQGYLTPAEFEELFRRLKANPELYGIKNPENLTLEHYGIGTTAPNTQNEVVAVQTPYPIALLDQKPNKSILRPEGAPKKNKRLTFNETLTEEQNAPNEEEYAQNEEENEVVIKQDDLQQSEQEIEQEEKFKKWTEENTIENQRDATKKGDILFRVNLQELARAKNMNSTLKKIEAPLKTAQLYFEADSKKILESEENLKELLSGLNKGEPLYKTPEKFKVLSPKDKVTFLQEARKKISNADTLYKYLLFRRSIDWKLDEQFPSEELINWLMTPPDQRSPIEQEVNTETPDPVVAQAQAQPTVVQTAAKTTTTQTASAPSVTQTAAKPLLTPVILTPVTAIAAAGAAATTNKPDIRALTEEEQKLIERFIRIPDMGILENASLPVLRALRSNDQVINFYKDKIYTALAFKESDLKKKAINTTSMEVFNQIIFDLPQENINILSRQLNARKGSLPLVDEKLRVLNLHAEKPFSSNNFKERNNKKKVTFSPTIRALPSIDILETDPQRFKFDTIQSQETTQDLDDDEDPYSFLRIASSIDSNRRKTYKNTILENYTPNKQEVGLFTGGTQEDVSAEENNELENNKNVASPYFQTLLNTTERDAAKKGKEVKEKRKSEKAKEFLTRLLFDEITPGDQLNTMIRRAHNLFLDGKDQTEFRDRYGDHPNMQIIDNALTNRSI